MWDVEVTAMPVTDPNMIPVMLNQSREIFLHLKLIKGFSSSSCSTAFSV